MAGTEWDVPSILGGRLQTRLQARLRSDGEVHAQCTMQAGYIQGTPRGHA